MVAIYIPLPGQRPCFKALNRVPRLDMRNSRSGRQKKRPANPSRFRWPMPLWPSRRGPPCGSSQLLVADRKSRRELGAAEEPAGLSQTGSLKLPLVDLPAHGVYLPSACCQEVPTEWIFDCRSVRPRITPRRGGESAASNATWGGWTEASWALCTTRRNRSPR